MITKNASSRRGVPILAMMAALLLPMADGSVLFPRSFESSSYHKHNTARDRRIRYRRRNALSSVSPAASMRQSSSASSLSRRDTSQIPPLAFGSLVSSSPAPWLMGALLFLKTAQVIRSEAFQRAMYFWANAGPIVFHYKFTKWWLRKTEASLEKRDQVYETLHNRYCQKSLDIALKMKGLYVKIAQIVSSRPDFVPPQYIELFTTVQDSIPQWPLDKVVRILDESYRSNFGLGYDDVFEDIQPVALGSASIGQVHRATLKQQYTELGGYNGGRDVAVKVMHPGAEETFHHDFQVFRSLCKVALHGWEPILDECYRQIMSEFDYIQEARNLATIRKNIMKSRYKKKVKVPEPMPSLCTKNVLVMEMLKGKKLADALEDELGRCYGGDRELASKIIARKQIELVLGKEKAEILKGKSSLPMKGNSIMSKFRLFLLYRKVNRYVDLLVDVQGHQIMMDGIFQGDPHPGNVLELPGGRLGLVDFGQVKNITEAERIGVAKIVETVGGHASATKIATAAKQLGFETKHNDEDILAKFATLFFDSDIDGKNAGCATPQVYFSQLTKADPLMNVPDVAVFVARASFILRGMGTLLDKQVRTSMRWSHQAKRALKEAEESK